MPRTSMKPKPVRRMGGGKMKTKGYASGKMKTKGYAGGGKMKTNVERVAQQQ